MLVERIKVLPPKHSWTGRGAYTNQQVGYARRVYESELMQACIHPNVIILPDLASLLLASLVFDQLI